MRALALLFGIYAAAWCAILPMKLVHISDGDTMIFAKGAQKITCRLEGIDTPEKFESAKLFKDSKKCGIAVQRVKQEGEMASQYAKRILKTGESYGVNSTAKDKYGRNLCRVYLNAHIGGGVVRPICFNTQAVEDGAAFVYKNGRYIKDSSFRRELLAAQRSAAQNQRGLWRIDARLAECMNR